MRCWLRIESEAGSTRTAVIDVGIDRTRLTEPGLLFEGLGFEVWQPPAEIGKLSPGGPAESAGLRVGDGIKTIDGVPTRTFSDLVDVLAARMTPNMRSCNRYGVSSSSPVSS